MRLAYVSIPRFEGPLDIAYPKYVQKLLQNIQISHLTRSWTEPVLSTMVPSLEQTGRPSDLRVLIAHI
jgi:hypothetical protein